MFFQRYKYTPYIEKRERWLRINRIVLCIFLIFIIYQLVSSYVVKAYRIQAGTMQPTLASGDMVIAVPFYSAQGTIERGTLVAVEPITKPHQGFIETTIQRLVAFFTFQLVDSFGTRHPLHVKPLIRRVVGVPGDTIYMEGFILHIKTKNSGHFLTEFEVSKGDYDVKLGQLPENWDASLPFSGTYPKTTLKEGEYFVLCDTRSASNDSRLWGPVIIGRQIKRRIVMRYWPLTHFSLF